MFILSTRYMNAKNSNNMLKIIYRIVICIALIGAIYMFFRPIKTTEIVVAEAQAPIATAVTTAVTPITPEYQLPATVDGMAPVISVIPTKKNVVFLTIDDGGFKDESVVKILAENHIKATLFLSKAFINNQPDFFVQLQQQGSIIEDHTLTHDTRMVKNQSYSQQKAEICGMSDYILEHYGHRPDLYRPPGGAYSNTMRKAAADCGIKAVVTWIATVNGGVMRYQIGNHLRPGDIVLMHFRPAFKQDINAFVNASKAAGLDIEVLENFIQ